MRHFVAYHRADVRGLLDREHQNCVETIGSKKSLKALRAAIGSRIWLFEGRGTTTGKATFSLVYSFIAKDVEDAEEGEEKRLSGSSVIYFDDEALNDFEWFKKLKTETANFSVGFQEVKNTDVVAQLEALLSDVDRADFGEHAASVFTEGGKRRVEISIRERSLSARLTCISHHGSVCFACGFDFARFYGARAEGFIEVHHRKQISESNGSRAVDPISDLVPLCANCHRVVHLSHPLLEVEVLKEEIKKRQ